MYNIYGLTLADDGKSYTSHFLAADVVGGRDAGELAFRFSKEYYAILIKDNGVMAMSYLNGKLTVPDRYALLTADERLFWSIIRCGNCGWHNLPIECRYCKQCGHVLDMDKA